MSKNNDIQLSELEVILKNENADYSIYKNSVQLESAVEGAEYYGSSLSETTPTIILKSKDKYLQPLFAVTPESHLKS